MCAREKEKQKESDEIERKSLTMHFIHKIEMHQKLRQNGISLSFSSKSNNNNLKIYSENNPPFWAGDYHSVFQSFFAI